MPLYIFQPALRQGGIRREAINTKAGHGKLDEQEGPLHYFFLKNGSNRSIGIGKRVVELLSAETSLRV